LADDGRPIAVAGSQEALIDPSLVVVFRFGVIGDCRGNRMEPCDLKKRSATHHRFSKAGWAAAHGDSSPAGVIRFDAAILKHLYCYCTADPELRATDGERAFP
jgi:hypothetical protein